MGTFDRPIGTEHTTISMMRFQDAVTALAFIEMLASVCRHRLWLLMATLWARKNGSQFYHFTEPKVGKKLGN